MSAFVDVALKAFGVTSHLADVGTDFQTGINFILRGDLFWGGLTLFFVLVSMLLTAILTCTFAIEDWEWKRGRAVLLIVFFPFVPLGTLVWDTKTTWEEYRGKDRIGENSGNDNINNTIGNNSNIGSDSGSSGNNTGADNTNNTIGNNRNIASGPNINTTDNGPINNASSNTRNSSNNNSTNNDTIDESNTSSINIIPTSNTDNITNTTTAAEDSSSTTSDDIPPHAKAAIFAKLSEALTEALPQCSIGAHVVFQSLYNPDVESTVEWYQWASLILSIASLSLGIATNEEWQIKSKRKKALFFIVLLPFIVSRLLVWATMGTIHSAMFILPLGTELLAFVAMWAISKTCRAKLWKWRSVIVATSCISTCYAIGGYFTAVDQAVTITSIVLNIIYGLIQMGLWWSE